MSFCKTLEPCNSDHGRLQVHIPEQAAGKCSVQVKASGDRHMTAGRINKRLYSGRHSAEVRLPLQTVQLHKSKLAASLVNMFTFKSTVSSHEFLIFRLSVPASTPWPAAASNSVVELRATRRGES